MLDDNIVKSINDYAKRDLPDDHFYNQLLLCKKKKKDPIFF